MSLEKGFEWSYKDHNFKGYSIAGQSTSIFYKNAKICFDIAQGLPFNLNAKLYCLTHLHADHAAGLSYLLSQRSLFRLPPAKIMLPKSAISSVQIILQEWMKLEGFEYDYQLIGVDDKENEYDFDKNYLVKAFKTTHRVDSYGYLIYQKKTRLKKELQNLDRKELLSHKAKGHSIEEKICTPLVAFTGDTQIEFLTSHPDILRSEILFMECTYLDNKKSVQETRHWGHTHLDEILIHSEKFANKHISLIHLSARYNMSEAQRILDKKMESHLKKRCSIFPRPF